MRSVRGERGARCQHGRVGGRGGWQRYRGHLITSCACGMEYEATLTIVEAVTDLYKVLWPEVGLADVGCPLVDDIVATLRVLGGSLQG